MSKISIFLKPSIWWNSMIMAHQSIRTEGYLRPTSNRAYIRYDHTIYCFQFVRVRLKSEREYSSTPRRTRMRVRSIVLKTIDRTAVLKKHSVV